MKNMVVFLNIVVLSIISNGLAQAHTSNNSSLKQLFPQAAEISSCFPETNEQRPIIQNTEDSFSEHSLGFVAQPQKQTGISKAAFNRILDKVARVYKPIFRKHGLKLQVDRLWDNSSVNAAAFPLRDDTRVRVIAMFGGMARHEEITEDGFLLVACHEIGHHLGGSPQRPLLVPSQRPHFIMVSNEGQSDYFATLKCARKVFALDNNVSLMRGKKVSRIALEKCQNSFSDREDLAICVRSAMASQIMGNVGAALSRTSKPNFATPDKRAVGFTDNRHPQPQCRMDSYFAGALCPISDNVDLSESDASVGACSRQHGDTKGLRPLCWYKPGRAPLLFAQAN